MKVKRIIIELEPDILDHKDVVFTELLFDSGRWSTNVPVYSKYTEMMHKVWQTIKPYIREEK